MTKKKIIKERDELARNNLQLKNKQSMIEYKLREYKEKNGNPYTLIRDINNIIRGEEFWIDWLHIL